MQPLALIISGPGSNRDNDVAFALTRAGATPTIAIIEEAVNDASLVSSADLIVIPGGFSFADALGAGRLFGMHLELRLGDALRNHVERGRPILGICNGFQTLVRTSLLPGSLGHNNGGSFICDWTQLVPVSQKCIFTAGLTEKIHCPIAHGEGRYTVAPDHLALLEANDQIALRYAGNNPNGSVGNIAGVCDSTGLVLGMMPHPENHVVPRQHPRHFRGHVGNLGLTLFTNAISQISGA